MRIMRTGPAGQEQLRVELNGRTYDASSLGEGSPDFWAQGLNLARELAEQGSLPTVEPTPDERYASPVLRPSAIICVGQNYAAHARESGAEPPTRPIIFLKTPNTIAGPNDDVVIPKGSEKTDWEVELGIVIGAPAWQCQSRQEAKNCIAGYVLANDLSERAWQLEISGGQWSMGKCAPGYLPLGPWVVTADEFNPRDVRLQSWVNDEVRQDSRTSDMIFDPVTIVLELSQRMRLEPGDVILTGTPQGVALSGRFPYLAPGDRVIVEIEGLGRQEQLYVEGC